MTITQYFKFIFIVKLPNIHTFSKENLIFTDLQIQIRYLQLLLNRLKYNDFHKTSIIRINKFGIGSYNNN